MAARELRREGHDVVVYEQQDRVGGVWVYDEAIEDDDLLGMNGRRARVRKGLCDDLERSHPALRANMS